ncbi:NUDIX domain-containing protein [Microbacterium sp. P04]|uniref:NUDIX hydrolase n=1 Tax=Microbacterium sp. P04 TaxID=3366947 RepID=UPI0037458595
MTDSTVFAAGGVVWRLVDGKLRVLLVSRASYRDLTLPKGKVEANETLMETAVREIREETGIRVSLGIPVGVSHYRLPNGREKIVHYWAAEATDAAIQTSTFTPNKEIAAVEWLSLKKARARLSYPVDREILESFAARVDEGVLRTFPLVALRHAKAKPRTEWEGTEGERPLTTRGRRQANALVAPLLAFGVRRIWSSPAERCVRTVTPLSAALGRRIERTELISQEAWEIGASDAKTVVRARVAARKPVVLCSHGPVLPDIMTELAYTTGTMPGAYLGSPSNLDTAAFSVAHLSVDDPGSGIIAIETHDPRF